MINIRPHRDRVLLELIPDDKISTGGIHIPDGAKRKYIRKAKILAVSNDYLEAVAKCKKPALIPGQTVWAVWNAGVLVEINGELPNGATNECRLLKSEDVWAARTFMFASDLRVSNQVAPPARARKVK